MSNPQLTRRMKNCLDRLIAKCTSMADAPSPSFKDAEPDTAFLTHQLTEAAALAALERETAILRAEWDSNTDISESEAESIHILFSQASEAVARLMATQTGLQDEIRAEIARIQSDLGNLREGRNLIKSYRAGMTGHPDFLDRNV